MGCSCQSNRHSLFGHWRLFEVLQRVPHLRQRLRAISGWSLRILDAVSIETFSNSAQAFCIAGGALETGPEYFRVLARRLIASFLSRSASRSPVFVYPR